MVTVAADGHGGLWAATDERELLRIDPEGELAVALQPFATERPIRGLVADTAVLSAWLTDGHTVVKVNAAGRVVDSLSFGDEIHRLAIHSGPADVIPPHPASELPQDRATRSRTPEKVQRTVLLTAIADTYLRQGSPNQNQGDESLLRVRSSGHNRALVRFNDDEMAAALNDGTLIAATLELFIQDNGDNWGADGRTVDAHPLLVDWNESGATWNCPDDIEPFDQSPDCEVPWDGGTFAATASDSVVHTNGLAGWIAFDVTADVTAVAGGAESFGWLLKKTLEGQTGRVEYASREVCLKAPRLVLEIEAPEPDAEPPQLAVTAPEDRFLINQPLPDVAVAYADTGSPLDLGSLRIALDGQELTASCTVCEAVASCPVPLLAEGSHTITAEIRDQNGNLAITSFTFDLLLGDGEHRVTLPAIADTYLRSGAKNQNQGEETFLRVRSSGKNRALVRFDVASAAPLVDTLHTATLELYIEHNGNNWGSDGRTVDAHRLLADWNELGATWNCPDDVEPFDGGPDCDTLWNGGTFDPLASASVLHEKEHLGWIQYDVTGDVDAALAGEPDFGWLIKKTAEGQSGLAEYTSREGTPGQGPRLVLVFDGGEPVDEEPPEIFLGSPADGTLTNQPAVTFAGSLNEPATLTLNGAPVAVNPDNQFEHGPVALEEGVNLFQLAATDAAGNTGELVVTVTLDTVPPAAVDPAKVTVGEPQDGTAPITGAAASAEPGAAVTITNTRTGEWVTADVAADGSFTAAIAAQPEDVLSLVVTDPAGNDSPAVEVTVPGELVELPPDPSTVAPALDRTVVTDVFTATEFLYTGDDPIQGGVAAGTIDPRRVAVIRGRVLDRAGAPLPGVTISIHGHPEFGNTMSRADGVFDLVVNGGGVVTLRYEKDGFPAVHRPLDTPWRDFVWVEDVVLSPFDPAVTTIVADAPVFQVARGTPQEDADGARTATLVFPPGTLAEMVLGDGTRQPLVSLSVRATEYTVGESGPAAMPAPLPSNVGYTYAVELSADEAVAAGAVEVSFDQAVFLYVENFIGFAIGGPVPIGYYDRGLGRWIGGENGRVVEVLGTDGQGRVELDVDGSGLPADAQQLAELGISDGEREQLAGLYQAGQSLWRSPITHFTPWDCNWPYAPPQDAVPPPSDDRDDTDDDEGGDDGNEDDEDEDDPCEQSGSVIECQNQILSESVAGTRTPYRLHYHSDRVPGRAASYLIKTKLSGATVPASLKRIELWISVAGQLGGIWFPPEPNQYYSFTWDGSDAYYRRLQGKVPVTIRKGYVYEALYMEPAEFARSWARIPCGTPGTFQRRITGGEIVLWNERSGTIDTVGKATLGTWDAREQGLGGWSFDVHHVYDPNARVLYPGHGGRRSARQIGPVAQPVAGTGEYGSAGDGGPALEAELAGPEDIALAPDGRLFIADTDNHRIRVVLPDRTIETFAGTGESCEDSGGGGVYLSSLKNDAELCGGDGPAIEAQLSSPSGVAVAPDGSVLIADAGNSCVRRVSSSGWITNVAGVCGGSSGGPEYLTVGPAGVPAKDAFDGEGDGGPATEAGLIYPTDVVVAPDGSFYAADRDDGRVRFVGTDGLISTVAGGGFEYGADGDRAVDVYLEGPVGLALGPNGDLFIAEQYGNRVRRMRVDGSIFAVAGTGGYGSDGDGGPAVEARIIPARVAVGADGSVYISDTFSARIRRISPGGVIRTFVGSGEFGDPRAGAPATAVDLSSPTGLELGPAGTLVFADFGANSIWQAGLALQGFSEGEIVIAGENGNQLFVFDDRGRHLRTVHALTGADILRFRYDADGLLTEIETGDGLVTTVQRDAAGRPTAVVAPFGQVLDLSLGTDGYLETVRNPAGETRTFSYDHLGRLTAFTDWLGRETTSTYDSFGRLLSETDPEGGFRQFSRQALGRTTTEVTMQTAEGRETRYETQRGRSLVRSTVRRPDGLPRTMTTSANGAAVLNRPDGSQASAAVGPDPRFGMQTVVAESQQLTLPSGLSWSSSFERNVELSDLNDPLSLESILDTVTVNGRSYTREYLAQERTLVRRSPEGRQSSTRLDDQGRVTETAISELASVRFIRNDQGFLTSIRGGSGDRERVISFAYNPRGRLIRVSDPLSRSTHFQYDEADRLEAVTLRDGRVIEVDFDATGKLSSLTPPGRPAHHFSYTRIGRLANYAPPEIDLPASATQISYNLDRQPVTIVRPDAQTAEFFYDPAGRLASVTIPTGELSFAYSEDTGLLAEASSPYSVDLSYDYDGFVIASTTWSGAVAGSVERTYNDDLRLAVRTVNNAQPIDFSYDDDALLVRSGDLIIERSPANGLITGTTLGRITTGLSYNEFGEPAGFVAAFDSTELLSLSFEHDKRGRITRLTESGDGWMTEIEYVYDDAGRLIEVLRDGSSTAEYVYDVNGNRTALIDASGTTTATYDDQDRLLTFGDVTYQYSANGDLLSKTRNDQTMAFAYDVLGNLLSVTLPDGLLIEYVHDARGRRVGKVIGGSLVRGFLYKDRPNPVAELDGEGNVVSRFVYGTRSNVPDYMIREGVTYRIVSDHLGSPRQVVDMATGVIVQELRYGAFGRVVLDTNPGFQPFGFAGGLYDAQTGLVRFGYRDYDAEVGRWTAKDPLLFLGGSSSLYVYAGNDPVNHVDPDGRKVVNNCDCTVFVKPGDDDTAIELPPGETYDRDQDGLAIPDKHPGEVFKTVDGIDATVGPDGEVETEVSDDRGFLDGLKSSGGQTVLGGWKDLDWLREVHEPDENGNVDHGWDALFNTADPEDDSTGCPLNQ